MNDDDVRIRFRKCDSIRGPIDPGDIGGACFAALTRGYRNDFQRASGAKSKIGASRLKGLDDLASDGSQAGDCNAKGSTHFADSMTDGSFVRNDKNFLMFRAA